MEVYLLDVKKKMGEISNPVFQLGFSEKDLKNIMEASLVYNLFRNNPEKQREFLTDEQIK